MHYNKYIKNVFQNNKGFRDSYQQMFDYNIALSVKNKKSKKYNLVNFNLYIIILLNYIYYKMNTADRDIYINNLKKISNNRKDLLQKNLKNIITNINKNSLLTDLEEEYKNFYSIYKSQLDALSKLSDYIDLLALENKNDKKTINNLKEEQKLIFKEMKSIKNMCK